MAKTFLLNAHTQTCRHTDTNSDWVSTRGCVQRVPKWGLHFTSNREPFIMSRTPLQPPPLFTFTTQLKHGVPGLLPRVYKVYACQHKQLRGRETLPQTSCTENITNCWTRPHYTTFLINNNDNSVQNKILLALCHSAIYLVV